VTLKTVSRQDGPDVSAESNLTFLSRLLGEQGHTYARKKKRAEDEKGAAVGARFHEILS